MKAIVLTLMDGTSIIVPVPVSKIYTDGGYTLVKWEVQDPNGNYYKTKRVKESFEEVNERINKVLSNANTSE